MSIDAFQRCSSGTLWGVFWRGRSGLADCSHLHTHAAQPVQQFRYTVWKNATDSSHIIDAMDLLHARTVGGFCIVSSDSDYTRFSILQMVSGGCDVVALVHETIKRQLVS